MKQVKNKNGAKNEEGKARETEREEREKKGKKKRKRKIRTRNTRQTIRNEPKKSSEDARQRRGIYSLVC